MHQTKPLYWLLAVVSVALTSCASAPTSPSISADEDVTQLVEKYFDEFIELNPVAATYIGDPRFSDRLANDIGPDYRAAMTALHEHYLNEIRRIDERRLSVATQLTKANFERECREYLEFAKFPGHLLPLDQLGALPTTFAEFGTGKSAQPFVTVRDYENFLRRAVDFSVWVDQAIVNMREGVKANIVQPRVVMEKVLPQLEAMIVDDVTRSLFYQPVEAMPDSFSAADRERLTRDYRATILHQIVPAYRRLRDYVRDEYLPHTRETVAWTALPGGKEWYDALARHYTTTDLDAAAIHRLGLEEVARLRGEMSKIQVKLGIPGELADFFRHVSNDSAQYYTSGADLLAGHRAIKARIDAVLPDWFVDFPKADYEIREVEAFRAQASAGAFYQRPSADGSRRGIFYVNTYNLKAQPKFAMTSLSLHEASPGHHFQISIQQEIQEVPRFRRFLVGYTAYTEGWALYSESLGIEMGLFGDPYQYFGKLNEEMLRAMRLVVDTGLHTLNWSREQAIQYMLDNSLMAPTDVEAEVERYIANPGQALGYKIGQLQIQEIRRRAEQTLGDKFDVKQFHSQVLRDGSLPMDVLSAKIERWAASQVGP